MNFKSPYEESLGLRIACNTMLLMQGSWDLYLSTPKEVVHMTHKSMHAHSYNPIDMLAILRLQLLTAAHTLDRYTIANPVPPPRTFFLSSSHMCSLF